MKDKLHYKHKRVNWSLVISTLGLQKFFYVPEGSKVRSVNKQCYLFLLREFGRKFIKKVKTDDRYFMDYRLLSLVADYKWQHKGFEDVIRIAKVKWIKNPEEDY